MQASCAFARVNPATDRQKTAMTTPHYQTIRCEALGDSLRRVTLSRPEAANALNTRMGEELAQCLETITQEAASDVRAVIVTGAGEKAFCAGADLKERRDISDALWQEQHHIFERAVASIAACPVPVIAAVNGVAYGGGCEIALACDFIYAADTARFALPEATLGIMPGLGGTQRLPRAIGERRALEMLVTGCVVSAQEAGQWGMVNQVLPAAQLQESVHTVAERIAAAAPLSVWRIKQAVAKGRALPLEQALRCELEAYALLLPTRDRREGIGAFNEKRRPKFNGT